MFNFSILSDSLPNCVKIAEHVELVFVMGELPLPGVTLCGKGSWSFCVRVLVTLTRTRGLFHLFSFFITHDWYQGHIDPQWVNPVGDFSGLESVLSSLQCFDNVF